MRCPICGREIVSADEKAVPFCSLRCKSIDLKRWMGEEYAVETVDVDELEKQIADGVPEKRDARENER